MAQLWDAEQAIDATAARTLIEAQFPQLAPADVRPLGEGWDNTVFAVNALWAFRFPRRAVAVPFLATEARLLPAIAEQLPLPIPVPRFHGVAAQAFPWPFLGYTLLPGTIAARAALSDSARTALAEPLAGFLRELHGIPLQLARDCGVPLDEIARLDSRRRAELTDARLQALRAAGVIAAREPYDAILDTAPTFAPSSLHLIHGDLHAGQMLVDAEQRLCGVIDWGDVHIGDPGTDLAAAHALLPPAAHSRLLAVYGPVPQARWAAARARATWHGIAVAAYAVDRDDAELLAEALTSLRLITSA